MIVFIDSSALVKVFVVEPGTPAIQRFITEALANSQVEIMTSAVTKAEMMAAFSAIRRGRQISQRRFEEIVVEFRDRWEELSVPEVTTDLIERSGEIGLNHKIKGCDAFQLSTAIEIEADVFISSDNDLNTAAKEWGLTVWNPVFEPQPTLPTASDDTDVFDILKMVPDTDPIPGDELLEGQ